MIIGYDAKRLFHNYTGLGYYSRTLVQSLQESDPDFKAILFDPHPEENILTKPFFESSSFQPVQLKSPAFYNRSVNINGCLLPHKIDVFHGLSNELPIVKLAHQIPTVVTIHDILYKSFHEDFPWLDRQVYQLKTKNALEKASTIVAISEATKSEIIKYFPFATNKIKVVYQSYDPIFDQAVSSEMLQSELSKRSLPSEYLLYVGSITQRKNLGIIIEALKLIPEEKRLPLFVAGKGNKYEKKIKELIRDHQLTKWIYFFPDLLRTTLRLFYSGAQSIIYPSLGEGFGLPVLEAIASNVPVITSNISSMPEAGGNLALYFDPTNAEQLAHCIQSIHTSDLLRSNEALRQTHLAKFSRKVISNQYLKEIYQPLLQ
ncbi:MAG: glycosyltransferase family 1 protein [Saprospiraceae bacterium]